MRESPTLQLLASQKKHLGGGLKVYDPMISEDVVENQYHNLDSFLNDIDIIVIMVAHDELRESIEKLKGKIVLDTRNIYRGECYHL